MSLSDAQQAALVQFKDVTNWRKTDDEATNLLSSCDWNLEMAVMLHFEGGAPPERVTPQIATESVTERPMSLAEELSRATEEQDLAPSGTQVEPVRYTGADAPSFIRTFLLAPLNLGYKMFNTMLYFLSYFMPFFPRLTGYYPANRNARLAEGNLDPKSTALRYIRWFEESYNVELSASSKSVENESSANPVEEDRRVLPFFEGGYNQALEKAKGDLKYLVIYLQSDEHEDTDQFNKSVLLSPLICRLLNRDDIIFWAGTVRESEAYLVSSGLTVSKFPFVAVVAPTPKTPTSNTIVMKALLKLQGCGRFSADQFLSVVEETIETHSPKLVALVLDKQERDAARQIVDEQNSAYERSLAQDRERERQKREAAARKEREALDRQAKKELHKQWVQWKAGELRKKLAAAQASKDKTARISIRLPNGKRVIKIFSGSDSIEDIYAYVECSDLIDDESMVLNEAERPVYIHKYGFQLISPMPRKIMKDLTSSIKDEDSLWPNGNLLVEKEEEE